jgi:hypothetical protein
VKRLILVVILMFGFSGKAMAWGPDGHHVVCRIAYDILAPDVRMKVDSLMAADTGGHHYTSFADACTYADDVRSMGIRPDDHFLNLSRTTKGVTGPDCAGSASCVLTAIASDNAVLESTSASPAEKAKALKFLGHWLGDVHQPLHISFADDRGGNYIKASGGCGSAKKLHSAWDTCLVQYQGKLGHGAAIGDVAGTAQHEAVVFAYADRLRDALSAKQITAWATGEPWQWANESFQITRKPAVEYCVKKKKACQYSATLASLPPLPKDHPESELPERTVSVDATYQAQWGPVVEKRLEMAGVRLAAMLTAALE